VAKIPMDLLVGQAPILDEVLPETVSSTFVAGEEAEVPLLTGTTDLEISGDFVSPGPTVSAVRARLLEDPAPALAAYRTQEELDLHVLADIMFTEPARHLARLHADDAPTFRYLFTIAPGPTLESRGGAPHSSELPFVFDDTRRQGHPVEDADALADQVADLWVDFATDGEPDGWPPAETDEIMTFTLDGPVVEPDPWAARLDLVEQGYERIRGAASGS
jgi:para-nitrobenzyl esterase